MCIIGNAGEFVFVGVLTMAPVVPVTSSTSPNLIQITKPKLPRKITRTPKINLNKYWSLFENVMATESGGRGGGQSSAEQRLLNGDEFGSADKNNEINENLSNERREINEIFDRSNERNFINRTGRQRCTCHFCLISDLRNVTVSERSEEVTEL